VAEIKDENPIELRRRRDREVLISRQRGVIMYWLRFKGMDLVNYEGL